MVNPSPTYQNFTAYSKPALLRNYFNKQYKNDGMFPNFPASRTNFTDI